MAVLPPSDGIKSLLTSYAATASYAIEVGGLPATPDKVIVIRDTSGFESNPIWLLDYPAVQIWIRGIPGQYNETYLVARGVKDLCLGKTSFTHTNNDRYVAINVIGDITFLGNDINHRPEFTINLQLIIEPATTSETNREAL